VLTGWADRHRGKLALRLSRSHEFDRNEGHARQALLDWTLAQNPTHVLAIDADEFVEGGRLLRATLARDRHGDAWNLRMEEVWELDGDCLCLGTDGGWRAHDVPMAYRVTPAERRQAVAWRIPQRKLAPGRVPAAVGRMHRRQSTGIAVL